MLLADYESYIKAQEKVDALFNVIFFKHNIWNLFFDYEIKSHYK